MKHRVVYSNVGQGKTAQLLSLTNNHLTIDEWERIKHLITPAMFPKGWPFFRDGWLQGRYNIIEKQ